MHWLFWQHARKRRIRSLERARQQALEDLDEAEAEYEQACSRLAFANVLGTKNGALSRIAHARQAVRLAGLRALDALDELEAARCER